MARLTQDEIDDFVKNYKNQSTFNQTKTLFKPKPLTSEEEDNPLKYYANNENFINKIKIYGEDRYGDYHGLPYENESNEDYIKRFMDDMSTLENNSGGGVLTINYLRGANDEQRANFGEIYKVYDDVLKKKRVYNPFRSKKEGEIGFFERGGARSVIFDFASDPINLFTLGISKLVAGKSIAEGTKAGIMAFIPKNKVAAGALGGGLTAGTESAAQDLIVQKAKVSGKIQDDVDYKQVALSGTLGSAFGSVLGGVAGKYLDVDYVKLRNQNQFDEIAHFDVMNGMSGQDITKLTGAEFADLVDALGKQADGTATVSEKELIKKGMQELKDAAPESSSVEPITRISLAKQMFDAVQDLIKKQEFRAASGEKDVFLRGMEEVVNPKTGRTKEVPEKISTYISRFFMEMNRKDPEEFFNDEKVIKDVLIKNNLTLDQFASMSRASASKAGQTLQLYSQVAKVINKIKRVDPEFVEAAKKLYKSQGETVEGQWWMSRFLQGADKNRRALMVSKISTTVRNAYTGASVVGIQTGADMLEAALHYGGKSLKAVINGSGSWTAFKTGLVDAARDSFGLVAYLSEQGLSGDAAKLLLANDPKLLKQLFRTLQEAGDADQMWWISKQANTLNLLQDSFFRRAFFMASVDKAMRRTKQTLNIKGKKQQSIIGTHRSTSLMDDTAVPLDILQRGVDDALKATFAYSPKRKDSPLAHYFVRAVEQTPFVGTAVFPFARFMTNAMAFQLKYSPLNFAYFAAKRSDVLGKVLSQSKDLTERELREFNESLSKSIVGGAMLWASYEYRKQNQDINWYNMKLPSGRTMDMRPMFPVAPYMLAGDLMYKIANGKTSKIEARTLLEGFTGSSFRVGVSNNVLEGLFNSIASSGILGGLNDKENLYLDQITQEKMAEAVGSWLGELTGGYTNNLYLGGLNQMTAMWDDESAKVRDSKQLFSMGAMERGKEAFFNQAKKNIPNFQRLFPSVPILNQISEEYTKESLPLFASPVKSGTILTEGPILSFFGFKTKAAATPIERELIKYGYESWEVMYPTGDRRVDSLIKKELGKYIETNLARTIQTQTYKNKTDIEKEVFLSGQLAQARNLAKSRAENIYKVGDGKKEDVDIFDKVKWIRLPRLAKKLAIEYFANREKQALRKKYGTALGYTPRTIGEEGAPSYKEAADIGRSLYNQQRR